MIRTTITLDPELAQALDSYIDSGKVANRSEAIRDLVRAGLAALPPSDTRAECIGVISCAVDQSMSELSRRIREARMGRHDEIMFTASVPVNHHETIDIVIVQGPVARVGAYARELFQERGVRHGTVALTPISEQVETHSHGGEAPHSHSHMKIRNSF
jgi:CopG family nickel-responsive transcriptional regulator